MARARAGLGHSRDQASASDCRRAASRRHPLPWLSTFVKAHPFFVTALPVILVGAVEFAPYGALLLFVVLIRLLALRYYDLYRLRGEFSFFEDSIRIFKSTAIGSLLIVAAAFLYRGGFDYRAFSYARGVFLLDFLIALGGFYAVRLVVRSAQTFFRARGINLIPTLVVGRGPEAALCIKEMRERPSLGYRVVGAVGSGSPASGRFADLRRSAGGQRFRGVARGDS